MGTMPKPTNTDPWQLMMAFANGGRGYGPGSRGGRYGRNGNSYIGSGNRSYAAPMANSSDNNQVYQDALQDYNQNKEIYPAMDMGPPPTMTQAMGGGYDGKTSIGASGPIPLMIRNSANARGIDPEVALRVAASEGGLDGKYRVGDGGSSGGPFQLHQGNIAGGGNRVGGLGDDFVKRYGHIGPDNVQQQIDFALDNAKTSGWGAWHGYKGGAWDGIKRGNGDQPVVISRNDAPPRQNSDLDSSGRVPDASIQRGKDQLQDQIQDMDMSQDEKQDRLAMQDPKAFNRQTASLEDDPNVDEMDPSSRLSWLV